MQRFDAFFERWDRPLTVLVTLFVVGDSVASLLDGKFDWRDVLAIVIFALGTVALAQRWRQRRRAMERAQ